MHTEEPHWISRPSVNLVDYKIADYQQNRSSVILMTSSYINDPILNLFLNKIWTL